MKTGLRPVSSSYSYFNPKTAPTRPGFIEFEIKRDILWSRLIYGNPMTLFTESRTNLLF